MKSFASDLSPLSSLHRFLEEWKVLTLAETDAITAEAWDTLEKLQSKKASLQGHIEECESKFFNSPNFTPEVKSRERERLRHFALELADLETKNRDSLAKLMALADDQLKESNRSIRSLRHVQQAYGTGGRSFWQTYS